MTRLLPRIPNWFYPLAVAVLIALSIARLVPAYRTFTQTVDEQIHVACGTEWLLGADDCDPWHPPLARVAIALGPWLKGIRPTIRDGDGSEGNDILYARGEYFQNLTLARMGILPFLIIACVVTYCWARRWFGAVAGVWAVFLLVNIPPVLGHAALATTDMAGCAMALTAIYQWMRWVETPSWRRAGVLSLAISGALLSKMSSFVFLPIAFGVVLAVVFLRDRAVVARVWRAPWMQQGCAGAVLVFVCLWAGYRFTLAPVMRDEGLHPFIDRYAGESQILRTLAQIPLPLTTLVRGIHQVYAENQHPVPSYFLGGINERGSWAFFPVLAAVKTPIGFLLLAGVGLVLVCRRRHTSWTGSATAAAAGALAFVCMTSGINVGLRHALIVYPFLAIVAGHAVASGVRSPHRAATVASLLLALWVARDAWTTHPDYFTYFNRLAGDHPEQIVSGSDLDWGQDLHRLSTRLKVLGVQDLSLAYYGTARVDEAGLPRYRELGRDETASGYIAVSIRLVTQWYGVNGSYAWVRSLTPIERIGKSIDLYYVAPPSGPQATDTR